MDIKQEQEQERSKQEEVSLQKKKEEEEEDDNYLSKLLELIDKSILQEEMVQVISDLVKYRQNLSKQLFSKISELENKALMTERIPKSFRAGWEEWKKNKEDKEKSSFEIFINKMDEED